MSILERGLGQYGIDRAKFETLDAQSQIMCYMKFAQEYENRGCAASELSKVLGIPLSVVEDILKQSS